MPTSPRKRKVWFITGASRGFGVDIAHEALERGDSVVATARDPRAVTKRFGERPNLLAARLDVTREADAAAAVKLAIDKFSRIDVLVNNAGYGLAGGVEESSDAEVRALFDVNVFGLLHVTRAVLPVLRRQRSGHVINMASVAGFVGFPAAGAYCATKFAVEALTESLAIELKPLGIFATVVEPGFFRTDFLSPTSLVSTRQRIDDYAETVGTMRSFLADADHRQPGDSKKLAKAILTLADAPKPPVRLPLGNDTVAKIREKTASVLAELEEWIGVATSTDHDDVKTKGPFGR